MPFLKELFLGGRGGQDEANLGSAQHYSWAPCAGDTKEVPHAACQSSIADLLCHFVMTERLSSNHDV